MRRRLGVYDFGVAKDDLRRTVETVKNSQAYTAASKTSEVVSKQWTNVRFVVESLHMFFISTRSLPPPRYLSHPNVDALIFCVWWHWFV
ncbi:unnamed protein product [Schistocephalus solidus]|uniref:Uncharacterized protein n=1 Tax=Schistocephalus solidus TaxID=70667 RepID=A0A3P7DNJ5_SCHSO|nr:unnamed protein product [Schistocephalus solidus]